jgi:chitin disaccharide deacetylase
MPSATGPASTGQAARPVPYRDDTARLTKHLIINADDFGASPGVNRGIVECHARGVLTSTSLMVSGPAAPEAAALGARHPDLSVGLHCDLDDLLDGSAPDRAAVVVELRRQLDAYRDMMGGPPTHLDSHHHVHREPELAPLFEELAGELGVPLRGDGSVNAVGGFYAQWELGVTELRYVSVGFLEELLINEVGEGWTELSCHPGYVDPDFDSEYLSEREAELRTLTDPRIPAALDELGIRLESYHSFARIRREA